MSHRLVIWKNKLINVTSHLLLLVSLGYLATIYIRMKSQEIFLIIFCR
jgi:hypothetical protein